MYVAPFAKNCAHWHLNELHQRSWHCWQKLLLSRSEGVARPQHHGIRPREEMPTGLPLSRASFPLSYTTWSTSNLLPQGYVALCRIHFCSSRNFLPLMIMLLTNSRHPSSLPGLLPSVVLDLSSRGAAVGWCYSVLLWYLQSLSWGLELFTIHWCCAVLIVYKFKQLFSSCAGVGKLKISNGREDRCCQTTFLYWQGEQNSFVRGASICGHL